MEMTHVAAFWQTPTDTASRREIVASIAGGLLIAQPMTFSADETTARKHGKRKCRKGQRK